MASLIKFNFLRNFSTSFLRASVKKNPLTGGVKLVDKISESDDGSMYIAWHPETDFPYEYSKPIPPKEVKNSASLVKEEAIQNAMAAFKNKSPEVARQELMRLTHTTKHRWFPRARDRKAKKTPMDRMYL